MPVALDAAHDAIALLVKLLGGEHIVGFANRVFANLLKETDEIVEAHLTRPAHREVRVLSGDHVGLHQLVIAQVGRKMHAPQLGDAFFRSHGAVPPWPSAAYELRETGEPSQSTRSSRS